MKFIKKHRKGLIIASVVLVLLILFMAFIITLLPDTKKSTCGNRVADIANHPISNEEINKVTEKLESDSKVNKVSHNLVCRKLAWIVTVNKDTSKDDAKKLASNILENLSSDVKSYYDIEVTFNTEDESDNYPFSGYKQRTRDNFVY